MAVVRRRYRASIFLPNLIWNIQHHWPFVELMRNIKAAGRDVELFTTSVLCSTVLLVHPLNAVIWIPGRIALIVSARSAVSFSRLVLRGLSCDVRRIEREELLPGANLSNASCRRCGGH
jgi:hypothetical protein